MGTAVAATLIAPPSSNPMPTIPTPIERFESVAVYVASTILLWSINNWYLLTIIFLLLLIYISRKNIIVVIIFLIIVVSISLRYIPFGQRVFRAAVNIYFGTQPWIAIYWPWIIPMVIAIAIIISQRTAISTRVTQALHLSFRHFVTTLVLLLPIAISFALIAAPVDPTLTESLKSYPTIFWVVGQLTNYRFWFIVSFFGVVVIIAYRTISDSSIRSKMLRRSKSTRVLTLQLVTSTLRYPSLVVKSAITTFITRYMPLESKIQKSQRTVISHVDIKSLAYRIAEQSKNNQKVRILLTGYHSFGGTTLITAAMNQAEGNIPWLVINFSITGRLNERARNQFPYFEIKINEINLGILSAHITSNSEQGKFLKEHARLIEPTSGISSDRLIYHIPLEKKVDRRFFSIPMRSESILDLNRFLTDLNKSLSKGTSTQYLQRAVVQLSGHSVIPKNIAFVFDKIASSEVLNTLYQLFENERIMVFAIARKEDVDKWEAKEIRRLKDDMGFSQEYIRSKWRTEAEDIIYIENVIRERLFGQEIPQSHRDSGDFDRLRKYLCYISKGITGDIHRKIENDRKFYVEGGYIKLEKLTNHENIKFSSEMQDILDINWMAIIGGVFRVKNEESEAKEDRARISIYYLLDWMIEKQFDFTRDDLLSAIAYPSEKIPITISDQVGVVDKIAESLIWVLIHHNYLEEKGKQYSMPEDKSEIKQPSTVPPPILKSLGLLEYLQGSSNNKTAVTQSGKESSVGIDQETQAEKVKHILFISANPKESEYISRREEKIIEAIEKKQNQVRIRIKKSIFSASIFDIYKTLENGRYDIVHISGHSKLGNLVVEDSVGSGVDVSQEGLATLISKHKSIECVVLSVCYSIEQGELIAQHVKYTIAVDNKISEQAAIVFTEGFYSAIGEGKEYQAAFEQGRGLISMHFNISDEAKYLRLIQIGAGTS